MSISISWLCNKEPDVSGYEVYRAPEHDGTYVKLVETAAGVTEYTDEAGEAGDWYKVRAFNTHGDRGPFGPEVEAIEAPTCRVYGNLTNLEGEPLEDAKVSAKTSARRLSVDGLGTVLPDEVQVETDANGWWQMQLYPNSKLTPSGSKYIFELRALGYEFNTEVEIPDQKEVDFSILVGA